MVEEIGTTIFCYYYHNKYIYSAFDMNSKNKFTHILTIYTQITEWLHLLISIIYIYVGIAYMVTCFLYIRI